MWEMSLLIFMKTKKIYWKNIDQLDLNNQEIKNIHENEFVSKLPVNQNDNMDQSDSNHSRRDFLKYLGYSTAAATLAACEGPVIKSVPYVVQPEKIIPGIANYYATTIADGYDFASVLIKTREGRPIFIKGNELANSAPNSRVIASVLSLYDSNRLKEPHKLGKAISWDAVDPEIIQKLSEINGEVVLLTNSIISPTTIDIIQSFKKKYNVKDHQEFIKN